MEWSERLVSGLQDDTVSYAREGVSLLMKDEWSDNKFDCKSINARILAAKFKCDELRMFVMVAYAP